MRNTNPLRMFLLISILVCPVLKAFTQTPSAPNSPSNPLPQWVIENQRKRDEFDRRQGNPPAPDLSRAERQGRTTALLPRDPVPEFTAADRRRIADARFPNPQDLETYKAFLSQKGTGIFRLFPFVECVTKRVISVAGECANFIAGTENYEFRPGAAGADIAFIRPHLVSRGFFSQYIIGNLGDVDLTGLSPGNPVLGYIEDFIPGPTIDAARKQYRELSAGVQADGLKYSNTAIPVLNSTYVFRVIAYRIGNNAQKRQLGRLRDGIIDNTVMFDALRHDTRIDLTLAFRIIRRDDDGSVSIIWKELSRKEAPIIRFARNEKWEDFK